MAELSSELRGGEERWWKKVVDVDEAKRQILFAMPMVLTNVIFYLIPVVSVMFAGHLGDLQLAASTLANSWANVTGYAIMTGLSVALETLCGQAYGAKQYKMLGIYLQTSCIISFLFSILISIIWWYTKPILIILLHQNHEVSDEAAIYMRYQIPGIYAYGTLQNIMRFLQTQSVVWPLVFCSLLPLLLQFGLVYILLHYTTLGFRGGALATSITFWISVVLLMVYVRYAGTLKQTWKGFSKELFRFILTNLKLALPSTTMVCLEYWAFEVVIMLAGLMPNSEASTSLVAMCTRVSNEIGAGRPDKAKKAMGVTLKLSILLGVIMVTVLGFGHNIWAGLFSDSPEIIKAFAAMTPFLCITIFLDSIQGILSGVSRGCGWQQLTTYINLGTFYFIGMPMACLLAFKLHMYAKGLWIGLICGLAAQSGSLFLVTKLMNWASIELSSDKGNSILGYSMVYPRGFRFSTLYPSFFYILWSTPKL